MNNASQTNLSPEQEAAVKMLAAGCSIKYTALVLGIKEKEIAAWIARDPAFQLRLKETEPCNPADESEETEKLDAEKLNDLVGE
jgi:hypothetical protein